jgi:hypothetical protein
MIILASTDLISLVTSAISSIDVHASWMDTVVTGGVVTVTPGRTNTAAITTATTTTVVGSPAASTQRNVKFLSVRNKHASVACDCTLQHNDGTTTETIIKTTLQPGECLVFYDGAFQQFLASGALKTTDSTNVSITGGSISGTTITAKAGTTTVAPITFTSGVNLTTPAAGAREYDGVVFYNTAIANERSVDVGEQFITIQGGTFTLTSQTPAQKLFNSPTNGSLTVGGARTYLFECEFDLSSMSATSGSFGFALGGTATFTYLKWWSNANKAALATAAASQSTVNANAAANTAIASATTNTVGWAFVQGILRVNAGGTIIPQVSLGIAAAAVVGRDSYFRIWSWGSNTVVSVGNWS